MQFTNLKLFSIIAFLQYWSKLKNDTYGSQF